MLIFAGASDSGVDDLEVDVGCVVDGLYTAEEDSLLTCRVAAGTDPNDITLPAFSAGIAAGEEGIGAATSSIDPKVKEGPSIAK